MNSTTRWNYIECGNGRPLILLHGIGMSHKVWSRSGVMKRLAAAERRVIAFDLPGFGETEALPRRSQDDAPTPEIMAEVLKSVLEKIEIALPVDIVGNSLGGYVALEFAKLGYARSVVGISPAGLWRGTAPAWVRRNLELVRWIVDDPLRLRHTKQIMNYRLGRTILLRIPVAAKGCCIPADEAKDMLDTFHIATDLDAVGEAVSEQFRGGEDIDEDVPCTIAFGDKDWLLRKKESQYPDELPKHHCWKKLPGCGHVAMWDKPEAVTELILDGQP